MTKKFMQSIPGVILLILVLNVLVGCGFLGVGGSGSGGGKVTLTWLVRSSDKGLTGWEQQTASAFEAAHPTIHINILSVPQANFDQKLITMNAAGSPPDVFSEWGSDSWTDFVYHGLVADLSPYIKASKVDLSGIDQKLLDQYKVGDKLYGIPFSTGGSYVFYNIDLFKQANLPLPPTDWNDTSWNQATLMHDAQVLSKQGASASDVQFGLSNDLWPEDSLPLLFGGDIFPESAYQTGVIDHVQANTPAVQNAVTWQQDLVYKDKVSPTQAEANAIGTGFMSGKIGMSMIGVWGFWVDKPATFHYAAAPLPYFQTDKDVLFTDPWMMAKGSKHPQEAWSFIQWLTDPLHGEKSYIEASGAVPPWPQLIPDWAKNEQKAMPSLSTDQLVQLAQGSLDHGIESINHRTINYGQYDSVIGNVLAPVLTNQQTPADGVNALQQKLTAAIKSAGTIKPLS